MPTNLKILLIDDHDTNQATSKAALQSAIDAAKVTAEIHTLTEDEKTHLIGVIQSMVPEKVEDNPPSSWFNQLETLHDIDIIFLDYQLRNLIGHAWLTAEDIAGIIRAFGKVPLVVILNRYQETDFDLTMMGAAETAADLHLNAKFLGNSHLWEDPKAIPANEFSFTSYRPWSWPNILDAVTDIKACRVELEAINLDDKLLDFLGFNDTKINGLTELALGSLNPNSKEPEVTTFKDFLLHGCVGLQAELRKLLIDNIDDPDIRNAALRVLVSEIRRWLTMKVLNVQDILIDPPHLAERAYWLLNNVNSFPDWNATISFKKADSLNPNIMKHLYSKHNWLSRICFWMSEIQTDPAIKEIYNVFDTEVTERFVFLEDFSSFTSIPSAEEFTAAFDSVRANRYISNYGLESAEISYAPKIRLL